MASRGVSILKFVGTVSVGLLTGLSFTLSTLTIPALLSLPSASAAAKSLDSLRASAKKQLRTLTTLSGSAFLLAYVMSPRSFRHPYLLYTSALIFASRASTSHYVAPYLGLSQSSGSAAAPTAPGPASTRRQQKRAAAHARMEASYEVLPAGSDAHSEGTASASGDDAAALNAEDEQMNGEEVRAKVADFLKRNMVHTAVSGLGFLMAVVGIWGDGVMPVYADELIIEM